MTTIEMVDPTGTIMREIADKRLTRDDVALTYAWLIRQPDDADFPTVNQAIVDRWSASALEYIKGKAWRMVDNGGRADA